MKVIVDTNSRGIQGSNTDFLICAVANRNKISIYTTDKDFELFSRHIQIVLHRPNDSNGVSNA